MLVRFVHRPEYGQVCLELSDFGNARALAQSEHPIFDGQPGVVSWDGVWQTGSCHATGVCMACSFKEWTLMIGR